MDAFTQGYMACALWSSNDGSTPAGGEPLDKNHGIEDIAPESARRMEADCQKFQRDNAALLDAFYAEVRYTGTEGPASLAGHDFWLTRNHHGSGFWDEEASQDVTKGLTDAAHAFGEQDMYVGDDGRLYVSGGEAGQLPLRAKLLKKGANEANKLSIILRALESGPKTTGQIETALGYDSKHSTMAWPFLQSLKDQGLIRQHKMRWHLVAHVVRGYAMTGARHQLQTWDWHSLKIALDTMRMNPAMAGVMGGPNEAEARRIIKRITGKEYEELPASMRQGRMPKSVPASLRPNAAAVDRRRQTYARWIDELGLDDAELLAEWDAAAAANDENRLDFLYQDMKEEAREMHGKDFVREGYGMPGFRPRAAEFHKFTPTEAVPGKRIRIANLSGIDSGKTGVILDWSDPAAREQAQSYPFVGGRTPQGMGWVAIRLDDGTVTSMPKDRIGAAEEETAVPQQASKNAAPRAVRNIEDDTPILPHVIAEQVVREFVIYMHELHQIDLMEQSADAEEYLDNFAQQVYKNNESFRKNIRAKGNKGRDTLYAFMRHWLSGYAKDHWPQAYRLIPSGFKIGEPMPKTTGYAATGVLPQQASAKTAMSRKDYILIANVLRTALEQVGNDDARNGVTRVAVKMAEALKNDNPMFNSDHFMSVVTGKKGLESRPPRSKEERDRLHPQVLPRRAPLKTYPAFNAKGQPTRVTIPEDEHEGASDIKPRLAGAKYSDTVSPELIRQAREMIEAEDPLIDDVAANVGQMVDNVKHMSWFAQAVAEWLAEDPSYYQEFKADRDAAMADAMHDEPGLHPPAPVM